MCFVNHASSKRDWWKVIECSEMYESLCYVDYEEWQAIFPWIDAYSLRFWTRKTDFEKV
jgi:hypothetical protein